MKDDRLRIPFEASYVEALGRALYVFAYTEWNAVYCCERMRKNYLHTVSRKTAGQIANDLVTLVKRRPDPKLRADCLGPAEEFQRCVLVRNGLVHSNPATGPAGEQRLFRQGVAWTPEMIDNAADEFAACDIALSHLLYNQLK